MWLLTSLLGKADRVPWWNNSIGKIPTTQPHLGGGDGIDDTNLPRQERSVLRKP